MLPAMTYVLPSRIGILHPLLNNGDQPMEENLLSLQESRDDESHHAFFALAVVHVELEWRGASQAVRNKKFGCNANQLGAIQHVFVVIVCCIDEIVITN